MRLAFLLAALLAAQDPSHNPDYKKCRLCSTALSKGEEYILGHYKSSGLAGHVFSGFFFLIDDSGRHSAELSDCVAYCCKAIRQKGFNENWYTGMSMFFLAEYALRFPSAEVHNALTEGARLAAERIEPETGGWCHHREYWKEDGYNKRGGGKDLGILTSMFYAAFLEMKSMGLDPGPTAERAKRNLESISDGFGFGYGTDNRVGDRCLSHGGIVFMGIRGAGLSDHPFAAKIIEGLRQRTTKCFEGHAFAPLHYFGAGAAMHRLGAAEYRKFCDATLDKLIAAQLADGSVPMQSDGGKRADCDKNMDGVASTAVLACLILLQQEGAFVPKAKGKGGKSPFSSR